MVLLGIDPGLDGALAVIDAIGLVVFDTPTLTVQSAKGNRREYDLTAMSRSVRAAVRDQNAVAYVEKVHAMPGQGVRSMFTMGYGSGAWAGILAALEVPVTYVSPQRWKKALLADMGTDKDASRLRAMQLFPSFAELFKRKKDDGRAEATLIAEYGRRQTA